METTVLKSTFSLVMLSMCEIVVFDGQPCPKGSSRRGPWDEVEPVSEDKAASFPADRLPSLLLESDETRYDFSISNYIRIT